MNAFPFDFSTNSSWFNAIYVYWSSLNVCIIDTFGSTKNFPLTSSVFEGVPFSLHFDEFQSFLVKTLLVILFVNLTLIFLAWKVYGRRICDRFMKPATSKAIEELKASVSKLKLPKEHTPRI